MKNYTIKNSRHYTNLDNEMLVYAKLLALSYELNFVLNTFM